MNKTVNDLQEHFRQLRLSETAEELPKLLREAEKSSWTYLEFLESITRYELALLVYLLLFKIIGTLFLMPTMRNASFSSIR